MDRFKKMTDTIESMFYNLYREISKWVIICTLVRFAIQLIRRYAVPEFEGKGLTVISFQIDKMLALTTFTFTYFLSKYNKGKVALLVITAIFPIVISEIIIKFMGFLYGYVAFIILALNLKMIVLMNKNKKAIIMIEIINIVYQVLRLIICKIQLKASFQLLHNIHFLMFYLAFNVPIIINFNMIREIIANYDKLSADLLDLFHTIPIPIFTINSNSSELVYKNQEVDSIFKVEENPTNIQQSICDVLTKSNIDTMISNNELKGENYCNFNGKDIKVYYKYLSSSETYVICIVDITTVKSIEEGKAKQSLQYVYMSSINHQLKTPLYGISGPLQVIEKECNNPNWKHLIRVSLRSVDQVILALDCYIKYNEFSFGSVQLKYELCNIKAEIMNIMPSYQFDVKDKNVSLIFEFEERWEYQGYCDMKHLLIVINILLANAVKYTVKGHVKLICRQDNNFLYLLIKDTGIGITVEHTAIIFEDFGEMSTSKSSCKTSSGIQLPLCKKIINKMNGEISLQSEINVGTLIDIRIPIKYAQICEENLPIANSNLSLVKPLPIFNTSSSHALIHKKNEGKKVLQCLIVDDNATNLFVLQSMLERMGAKVEKAFNGEEGVAKYVQRGAKWYDIVFMDINMPVMDGYEAIKRIRAFEEDGVQVRMVIATAQNEGTLDEVSLSKLRIDKILYKPISLKELQKCVKELSC